MLVNRILTIKKLLQYITFRNLNDFNQNCFILQNKSAAV